MQAFTSVEAIAAPLDIRNLDTNQLCPTRFNKLALDDPDYGRVLFNNQRFDDAGDEIGDFILNQPPYRDAKILVADDNFGCGSSRESAVYALQAFGVRAVIAPSFGDIFFANCTKNGLLPVVLDRALCDALRTRLHAQPGMRLRVDLESQTVTAGNEQHDFQIHPGTRNNLLEGLDDVGVTRQYMPRILAFEARRRSAVPWL